MKFQATIHLKSTSDGGRNGPIATGYRPSIWSRPSENNSDGYFTLLDTQEILPGGVGSVEILLLHPHLLNIEVGSVIQIKEGLKQIGSGVVNSIIEDEK